MAAAVARQEHEVHALEGSEQQLVGRLAPRAFDALPARVFEARNVVDAAAADDAENRFCHVETRCICVTRVLACEPCQASKWLDVQAGDGGLRSCRNTSQE